MDDCNDIIFIGGSQTSSDINFRPAAITNSERFPEVEDRRSPERDLLESGDVIESVAVNGLDRTCRSGADMFSRELSQGQA